MTSKDFKKLFDRRYKLNDKVMNAKAGEYSSDLDRLYNFKRAASIAQSTQAQALWGMFMKHLVSIIDIVESGETPSQERADEKLGDAQNYLSLLEAIWAEERLTK